MAAAHLSTTPPSKKWPVQFRASMDLVVRHVTIVGSRARAVQNDQLVNNLPLITKAAPPTPRPARVAYW
jgi:hypothetical protein